MKRLRVTTDGVVFRRHRKWVEAAVRVKAIGVIQTIRQEKELNL